MNAQITRVALVGLGLIAALIVGTTYWQTWAPPGLSARADNEIQRVAQFTIERGTIYAADGKTVLARNVSREVGGKTLYFRRYPTNGLASQTVGYSTQSRARAGLENTENAYLTGSNADLATVLNKLGNKLTGSTIRGNDIVLTIRPKAQRLAEQLLSGSCGAAVLLDPRTGAVEVMASSPGYNPNLVEAPDGYSKIQATESPCPPQPASPLFNRATQGLYPPGSIFKTITAAAALDSGRYSSSSSFYDTGYCTEYGKRVFNALDQSGPEAFGNVTLIQSYEHSINAVFCDIGKSLGARTVLDQAKKFGFYSNPPLETPGESRAISGIYHDGHLFDPQTGGALSQVDPGRLAFGQDKLLTTPLQMAMVAAAIGNHGTEMRPTLIKRIVSPGGEVIVELRPRVYSQATKRSTADAIREMMVQVVQGGTGTAAQIPGVSVAGKTGTAETCTCNHIYDAWFIFFAPADHPTIAGAVVVELQPDGFGGSVAAPIARQLMQATLPSPSNTTPAGQP